MCSTKCKGVVWCKKVIEKMTEEGIKKIVEGLLIAIIIGVSVKTIIAIPAITVGAGVAKIVATKMLR